MRKTHLSVWIGIFFLAANAFSTTPEPHGCWFMREEAASPKIISSDFKSVFVGDYFQIYYPSSDQDFRDNDRNGIPDLVDEQKGVLERSHHFLATELGWKLPATRQEMNRPLLAVYFVAAPDAFTGTTRSEPFLHVLFNKNVLSARDFAALWIHQLAHAAESQYRPNGEYWFYEATAGWMEGQFNSYSEQATESRRFSLEHANIPLTSDSNVSALGASRFLDLVGRPYRDVIRQVWENLSYSKEEPVLAVLRKVLAINHLPDLDSYFQNYYLACSPMDLLSGISTNTVVKPYSAVVLNGLPENGSSGGITLSFVPSDTTGYSASLVYYDLRDKSGTLAMKKGLQGTWSILVPYRGLDHYKLVIVNASQRELRGVIQRSFDATIPAVVEYFHVNPDEGGVQIEWKTTKENGVAFWNLYKLRNGSKELLNSFPIPAAIHSEEGLHYLFVDNSDNAFYSLEAITEEGFQSPVSQIESSP